MRISRARWMFSWSDSKHSNIIAILMPQCKNINTCHACAHIVEAESILPICLWWCLKPMMLSGLFLQNWVGSMALRFCSTQSHPLISYYHAMNTVCFHTPMNKTYMWKSNKMSLFLRECMQCPHAEYWTNLRQLRTSHPSMRLASTNAHKTKIVCFFPLNLKEIIIETKGQQKQITLNATSFWMSMTRSFCYVCILPPACCTLEQIHPWLSLITSQCTAGAAGRSMGASMLRTLTCVSAGGALDTEPKGRWFAS